MSYKYMLLDSRGAPVAQGVSEDGPEKNVWQLRIAHGDIKRVLGHEYISGGNLGAVPGDGRADCPVPG